MARRSKRLAAKAKAESKRRKASKAKRSSPAKAPVPRPATQQRRRQPRRSKAAQQSFEPFPRLPLELRRQIWQAAVPLTQYPGVCVLPNQRTEEEPSTDLVVLNPLSALSHTSREARAIAQENSQSRPYDPKKDILYIGPQDFDWFAPVLCKEVPWAPELRHLALTASSREHDTGLPYAMKYLKKLETLSIVYPAAEGTVEVFAPVPVPEEGAGRLVLRRLTDDELDNKLRVEADYVYNTWFTDFDIKWSKSGREHMEHLEKGLDQDVKRENGQQLRSYCEPSELAIRLEARCFVWNGV